MSDMTPDTIERWTCNECGEFYVDWGEPCCPHCGSNERCHDDEASVALAKEEKP